MADSQEQTLSHLRLVAGFPGFWEIRALQRLDGAHMEARGSFFIIATATPQGLIYDRLESAVDWADDHASRGAEIFVGMNPRTSEGKGKDAVEVVTACYVDLDLPEGLDPEDALAELTDGDGPRPTFVVSSGYGLHVTYLLREPSPDKATWKKIQRALCRRFVDLGADRKVAPDESRVLRLVPYPNRKRWPEGLPTGMLYISEERYALAALADAVGLNGGTDFSRLEVLSFKPQPFVIDNGDGTASAPLPDADEMDELIQRAERTRAALNQWIMRNLKPGLHFGAYAVDGQDPAKPTLLKPGAEQVALLYGWRFAFTADLDSLQMYGPTMAGAFAYVCHVIDADGRIIYRLMRCGLFKFKTIVSSAPPSSREVRSSIPPASLGAGSRGRLR